MMKKTIAILTFLLLSSVQLLGKAVDIEEARLAASRFLTSKSAATTGSRKVPARLPRLTLAHERITSKGNSAFYVFNSDTGGFVIVSGDDRAEAILGYADNGVFTTEDCPENIKAWLEGYEMEMEMVGSEELSATAHGSSSVLLPDASWKSIPPLMTSRWDQFEPYNQECPVINGSHAPTGCGPTAIAQILYYHKWPRGYTEAFDALPSVKFDWNNMTDSYDNSSTDAQKNAVATLMLYCGHACDVRYNASSSSSSDYSYPNAFKRLGFSRTPTWRSRSSYPLDKWEALIYNELANARPVLYSAASIYEGDRSGHAFVCDGYDGSGMFHINWGWGGRANGYFRLQALNPYKNVGYAIGYGGYSLDQVAVFDISPDEVEEDDLFSCLDVENLYLAEVNNYDDISEKTCSYDKAKGLGDFCVCYRFGYTATYYRYYGGQYDSGLGLFSGDELIDTKMVEESANSVWHLRWMNLDDFGKNLPDGIYLLKGISRKHGTVQWVKSIDADNQYVRLEVKDGVVTARSVCQSTDLYRFVGLEQLLSDDEPEIKTLRLSLHNGNTLEDSQWLYLYVDGKEMNCEQTYIPSGKSDYVDFVFKASKGFHTILITSDATDSSHGYGVIYMNHRYYLKDAPTDVCPLSGDVNSDRIVDNTDLRQTVDYVIGKSQGAIDTECADMDYDGTVDISDVADIVGIILGRTSTVSSILRVAPAAIDFGTIKYGTSQTRTVTVSNDGDKDVCFSISGRGAFDVSDAGRSVVLPPGRNHYLDVTYTPVSATCQDEGVITFRTNAANGHQNISLKGAGCLNKDIHVEPMYVDFGIVKEGTVETEHFTVTNVGMAPVTFKIDFGGNDIFEIDDTNKDFTIQPGQSKVFTVRCNGIRPPYLGAGSVVYIRSDATNADDVRYINLGMDGGDPYPTADAVDLGLPSGTKWASHNMGAFQPTDDGDRFAWGETSKGSFFWWSRYSHCDGSSDTCHDLGDDICGTVYDVAHEKWGGSWQLPTLAQAEELISHCTAEWVTVDGVSGTRFTGKNGNSIFVPAGGAGWGSDIQNYGICCTYWTGTVYSSYDRYAYHIKLTEGEYGCSHSYRYYGYLIRPVTR